MLFRDSERRKVRAILKQVVERLMEIGVEGVERLDADQLMELKAIARGLGRVRLRRLSSRLTDLCDHLTALAKGAGDGDGQLAMLITDCLQTAKFIKAQLSAGSATESRDVLDEVFDCRWEESDLERVEDVTLVELAVESLALSKTHRLDVRHYIALETGAFYIRRKEMLFPESEDEMRPRPSNRPVMVRRAFVFPGHPPREIRVSDGGESGESVDAKMIKTVLQWISPTIEHFRAAYIKDHKNYFAPLSSPILLAPHAFVSRGRSVYVMDSRGAMIRIEDSTGPTGVRFLRSLERSRVRLLYGRCYVDDTSYLSLAPLSAVVLRKNWRLEKYAT